MIYPISQDISGGGSTEVEYVPGNAVKESSPKYHNEA
jgi:hypothetical protein